MADEKNVKSSYDVYQTLCAMLDDLNLKYSRDDESFAIQVGIQGEDFPVRMQIRVNPGKSLISVLSQLPFSVPEEKRVEMSVAISMANYLLVDGSFDYNIGEGDILFRLTSSYLDSLIGKEMLQYMLMVSYKTIDDFNDKFFMLMKEKMSLDEFAQVIKNN
ncbi:MAG: YbjN domain-containing protein [Clostridia bacterium]|nr:YbjN domain-containing protein [Clostridia bacterium]